MQRGEPKEWLHKTGNGLSRQTVNLREHGSHQAHKILNLADWKGVPSNHKIN